MAVGSNPTTSIFWNSLVTDFRWCGFDRCAYQVRFQKLVEDWCFILAHSAEYNCPMHRARFYAKCIILRWILVMVVQSNSRLPSSNVFWHCKSNLIQNKETSPERSQRKCTKPDVTPWIDSIARRYAPQNPNTGSWKVWHVCLRCHTVLLAKQTPCPAIMGIIVRDLYLDIECSLNIFWSLCFENGHGTRITCL